jgi:hypothetical protein
MFDSAVLEVIIGMIFIYSLLSILVTQINSLISTVFRLRARHLRQGIGEMITDDVIRAKVLTHPLIRMIDGTMVLPDQVIDEDEAQAITDSKVNDVSWIDPKTFANVLMSLIRVDSDKELFGAMLNIVDGMPSGATRRRLRLILNRLMTTGEGLDELRDAIQNIPETIYRDALLEALDEIDDEIGKLGLEPSSIVSVMAGLRNIKDIYFRTALNTILATSQSLVEAEEQIVKWFNDTMDRGTQTFAQRMQGISLLVGILIAVVLNVDSIHIARTLWEDPTVRATVTAIVETTDLDALEAEYAEAQARIAENTGATAGATAGATSDTTTSPEATPDPNADTLDDIVADATESAADVSETLTQLTTLSLPVGWSFEDLSQETNSTVYAIKANDPTNLWNMLPLGNGDWFINFLVKVIGWGATVIAIAQGAPFWFNLLRRLTGR